MSRLGTTGYSVETVGKIAIIGFLVVAFPYIIGPLFVALVVLYFVGLGILKISS